MGSQRVGHNLVAKSLNHVGGRGMQHRPAGHPLPCPLHRRLWLGLFLSPCGFAWIGNVNVSITSTVQVTRVQSSFNCWWDSISGSTPLFKIFSGQVPLDCPVWKEWQAYWSNHPLKKDKKRWAWVWLLQLKTHLNSLFLCSKLISFFVPCVILPHRYLTRHGNEALFW